MFIAYEVSIELIRNLRDVAATIKRSDRDLADQLQRAASSAALNLGEGSRFSNGNARRHFLIAQAARSRSKRPSLSQRRGGWWSTRQHRARPSIGCSP